MKTTWTAAIAVALFVVAMAVGVGHYSRDPVAASVAKDFAMLLRHRVTTDAMMAHLARLQEIADENDGNRGIGTPGYEASVDYVVAVLQSKGFDVQTPEFEVRLPFADTPALTVSGVEVPAYPLEFTIGTPPQGVTGPLVSVRTEDAPGCSAADYDGSPVVGAVVLVDRGGCTFSEQQATAAERGAIALIVADNVDEDEMHGTLGAETDVRIPVISVNKSDGARLRADSGDVTLTLNAGALTRTTRNVIAQTKTGSNADVVMVGAHLDSVPWGPGINDNGSGVAAVLETAVQLGSSPQVNNAIRFGIWGAEEAGLAGSRNYVESLDSGQLKDIALYLNFDTLGSPNPGFFVYDGGPLAAPGSAGINRTLAAYLDNAGKTPQNIPWAPRSDFVGFMLAGVPMGGLFSGAEKLMSGAQARLWGGIAGEAFDPNYHRRSDTLKQIDRRALSIHGGGVAYAVGLYANYLAGHNGVPERDDRTRHPRPCAAGIHRPRSCNCVVAISSGAPSWSCAPDA